jgi:hypothetical protein
MQVTLVLVVLVFFVNASFKRGLMESLFFSVALAVNEWCAQELLVKLHVGNQLTDRHGMNGTL